MHTLSSLVPTLLAQAQSDGGGFFILLIQVAIAIAVIAGLWKIFVKAGQPGWAAIVPFYNIYILTKIVGRPWWWLLLFLIPFVNFIVAIILSVDLAKSFGKSVLYGVGLALLGFIFYPLLGFGPDQYRGPAAGGA